MKKKTWIIIAAAALVAVIGAAGVFQLLLEQHQYLFLHPYHM